MKILYVITKGNWGGAQKYVYELATHMPKSEIDVSVACGEGDILPAKLKDAGIAIFKLNDLGRDVNVLKDASVFFSLISLFRKEKPDIVHLNSSKIGGIGALAARIAGVKKIIFTVHGFAFNEQRPWIQKKIIAFLSWLTIIFSTDVIFISEQEKNRASAWPGISHKAHLIYNGIAAPAFLDRTQARTKLAELISQPISVFDNKLVVLTIGELTSNKGYRYALDALRDLSNIVYVIIGQGELQDELRNVVQENHLENSVFFAGFVNNASILLKAADLFLLPSLKEGMPYVLLEAGFASVPVITTDVGGIREMITDQESGFIIAPRSTAAIQKALIMIQQHPNLLPHLAEQHFKKVSSTFTLQNMVDNTVAFYHNNTI